MSKTAGPCIVAEGLGLLVPMPDRFARSYDALVFFQIGLKTRFEPVLSYLRLQLGEEVNWSFIHL